MGIRVLIAEDHGVVADALRALLDTEADIEVIGCVADGRAAVQAVKTSSPDLVVMDFSMPSLNGAEATRAIRGLAPATRVLMLSMHTSREHVRMALRAGASAYVLKSGAAGELVNALRAVIRGERYLSPAVAQTVVADYASGDKADLLLALSRREREVLQLLAEGCATVAIAERLALSPKTVETYRARVMDKLDIHDIASLVRFALRHGVASLD